MDHEVASKPASGSDRKSEPDGGGDHIRKAQKWGGGWKGPATAADRANEQSSAKI